MDRRVRPSARRKQHAAERAHVALLPPDAPRPPSPGRTGRLRLEPRPRRPAQSRVLNHSDLLFVGRVVLDQTLKGKP